MKWVFGTIALLLLGFALKLSLLVYAMYVLLGVMVLSRFYSRNWVDSIAALRLCDSDLLEIGEAAKVQIQIRNKSHSAIPWMILEDAVPKDTQTPHRLKIQGQRLAIANLKRDGELVLAYKVIFLRRGYYQFGPLLAETGDVFGLHRRYRIMADPHFVMVLPKVLPLRGYNLSSRRPIGEIRLAHRLFEDPTRIAAIRTYQPGDPLNRIHWPATARTGKLHSRVYETSCVAGATLLLDFHENSFAGNGGAATAELAITTVASLANAIHLMGQQVGFISNGRDAADRIREEGWRAEFTTRADAQKRAVSAGKSDRLRPVVVPTRKEQFDRILRTLARLEHTDGMRFPEMITETASQIPRDATVIAVLRDVTPAIAIALGALVQQGLAVEAIIVSFEKSATPDWARPADWAEMLLVEGINFRVVTDEESLTELCAEALVRTH